MVSILLSFDYPLPISARSGLTSQLEYCPDTAFASAARADVARGADPAGGHHRGGRFPTAI